MDGKGGYGKPFEMARLQRANDNYREFVRRLFEKDRLKDSWPDEDRFAAGMAKINLDGKGGVLKSLCTWAKKQQALRQPNAAAPGH